MHKILKDAAKNFKKTGNLTKDVESFLEMHACTETFEHVRTVAKQARELAPRFFGKAEDAFCAGLLHDISAVFPNEDRLKVAAELDLEILPEEKICPAILHQKISQVIASEIFEITDENILSAIGCHTTLKKDASVLDKIIFISDKIKWDKQYKAPYLDDVLKALEISLDEACFCYLNYLWQQKEKLAVIHPWLATAHEQLFISLEK